MRVAKEFKKTRIETPRAPGCIPGHSLLQRSLRKQGLKHIGSGILHYISQVAGESRKTRIETTNMVSKLRNFPVAKESKKTRIETSNLLEKGLIQKQVRGFRYLPRLI
ncbi:MAG: hypothetical protein OCU17_04310, partial [Methanophagales archaeon]|nr:hypothetical protein [Methanophagales archaeon]